MTDTDSLFRRQIILNIPTLECPVEGCDWQSQDLDAAFAAVMTAVLQIHDRTVHQPAAAAAPKLKLDPPTIAAGCDPDQWSAFTRQWEMYKVGMAIAQGVISTALFYCCDSDLRTDIMRDQRGNITDMPEADLMNVIKRLAVKDESTLVQRIKLTSVQRVVPGDIVIHRQGRVHRDEDGNSAIRDRYKNWTKDADDKHSLEHHIFEGQWIARPSKPHPMLLVNMTHLAEDHASFGHPIEDVTRLKTIQLSMVAVTGCQSTVIQLQTANNLRITRKDLLPVKLVMRGAIKENLGVIVAVAVEVKVRDGSKSTRILCFVSDVMVKAFICREVSLGIIHADFPNHPVDTPESFASIEYEPTCSCPRRQTDPPPLPTTLPPGLDATEENVDALNEWLLDYYAECSAPQQLHVTPRMDGSSVIPPVNHGSPATSGEVSPAVLTPKSTAKSCLSPRRLLTDKDEVAPPTEHEDKPKFTRLPRALARLQPHNAAGKKELLTPQRLRRNTRQDSMESAENNLLMDTLIGL
ncbi:hypothetical protein KUTeg_017414 [Tegillarca granosa]|uniref:Uncharacterized protein n=1 Tax=Tegillarca granosa TaxID=220873 RepID=A0ABQ9EID3_TEGGR|nr:hypothetical protein KUTeg_017414 [Tegillarca granosa]